MVLGARTIAAALDEAALAFFAGALLAFFAGALLAFFAGARRFVVLTCFRLANWSLPPGRQDVRNAVDYHVGRLHASSRVTFTFINVSYDTNRGGFDGLLCA
jgi:hypothetical protein